MNDWTPGSLGTVTPKWDQPGCWNSWFDTHSTLCGHQREPLQHLEALVPCVGCEMHSFGHNQDVAALKAAAVTEGPGACR